MNASLLAIDVPSLAILWRARRLLVATASAQRI